MEAGKRIGRGDSAQKGMEMAGGGRGKGRPAGRPPGSLSLPRAACLDDDAAAVGSRLGHVDPVHLAVLLAQKSQLPPSPLEGADDLILKLDQVCRRDDCYVLDVGVFHLDERNRLPCGFLGVPFS